MKKTNLSQYNADDIPSGFDSRIALVVAEWNAKVTDAMAQGAWDTLVNNGVDPDNIKIIHVPGSFELTTGADFLLSVDPLLDAVICIGCVVQGETRHFDFICEAVSQGITNVALKHSRPVIFSVLTTNDMQQAVDRSGGKHGNKGVEGAVTALKMVALRNNLKK